MTEEPDLMCDDLTGRPNRIEFLRKKAKGAKEYLRYCEELVTHETCLMNGQHYRIKANEVKK